MYQMALKIESQLKRKGKHGYGGSSSTPWKGNWKKEENESLKGKSTQATPKEETPNKTKVEPETQSQLSGLHCFRCNGAGHIASQNPNKRAMIVVGNNEY